MQTLEREGTSRQRRPRVRVDPIMPITSRQHPPDAKRGWMQTALGVGAIVLDVAREVADTFGPLKAALGAITAIYENYEVRLRT